MSKDIGVIVPIPPDLKAWVDSQAEDIGLNAAIWIRMLVFQARKKRSVDGELETLEWKTGYAPGPVRYHGPTPVPQPPDDDVWRGSPDDDEPADNTVDVEAMIASRVAEAERAGLTAPASAPLEAFAPGPTPNAGASNVRSLRRPPPQFSPSMQPGHLRNL